MRDGKIAWAVSSNQTENFGSYLERIGMIPKDQHTEIVNKYRALGKTKKLGSLLEEAGLITREKLKECLMAHIRAAIASILQDNEVIVNAKYGEMNVDSNLLFLLKDVLPEDRTETSPDTSSLALETPRKTVINWREVTPENNEILKILTTLQGYQYSFISGGEGSLFAVHKADNLNFNFKAAISASVCWINSARENAEDLYMEKIESLLVENGTGSLIVQWTDVDNNLYIAASFSKAGKLGVVKHKICELIPAVHAIKTLNSNRQEN
jgi:predicted regulator of Ras-like GTPase activity (Roadblock/LC7/MglB family)